MVQNIVAGLVLVVLIVLGVIGYAQVHHECLHGRLIKTLQPCGYVSPSI
jgi:hypothetical protein